MLPKKSTLTYGGGGKKIMDSSNDFETLFFIFIYDSPYFKVVLNIMNDVLSICQEYFKGVSWVYHR